MAADNEVYAIEKIIKSKTVRGQKRYLVRWEGFDEEEDEWKSLDELLEDGCQELIEEFEDMQKVTKSTRKSAASEEPTPLRRSSRLKMKEKPLSNGSAKSVKPTAHSANRTKKEETVVRHGYRVRYLLLAAIVVGFLVVGGVLFCPAGYRLFNRKI